MAEILNFKKKAIIIKLNTAVINLNIWGILMSHCGTDKNTENIPLNWLRVLPQQFEVIVLVLLMRGIYDVHH
jgi:hypothetical protein